MCLDVCRWGRRKHSRAVRQRATPALRAAHELIPTIRCWVPYVGAYGHHAALGTRLGDRLGDRCARRDLAVRDGDRLDRVRVALDRVDRADRRAGRRLPVGEGTARRLSCPPRTNLERAEHQAPAHQTRTEEQRRHHHERGRRTAVEHGTAHDHAHQHGEWPDHQTGEHGGGPLPGAGGDPCGGEADQERQRRLHHPGERRTLVVGSAPERHEQHHDEHIDPDRQFESPIRLHALSLPGDSRYRR